MSIEITQKTVYNDIVIKDSPISTPPVVSPTSNTKERRQHGKTAIIKTTKGVNYYVYHRNHI